jgi:hypothetical protein
METLRPSPQVSGSDLRLNWSSSIRSSSKRTRLDRRWLGSAGRTRWRPGDATNCSVDGSVYQPSNKVKINIDNMYNRTARRYGGPGWGQEWQRSQAARMNGLSPVHVSKWPHRRWSGRLRVQCAGVDVARARTTARKRVLPGGVVVDPSAGRNSNFFCLSKTKRHCLQ